MLLQEAGSYHSLLQIEFGSLVFFDLGGCGDCLLVTMIPGLNHHAVT